jgi:hypothetical protein
MEAAVQLTQPLFFAYYIKYEAFSFMILKEKSCGLCHHMLSCEAHPFLSM